MWHINLPVQNLQKTERKEECSRINRTALKPERRQERKKKYRQRIGGWQRPALWLVCSICWNKAVSRCLMAEGNRDKSSRQRRAKRPRQRLKDEEMRIVMDVLLYLVQVHASTSCLASTEMDCGLPGSTRAVSCGSNLSGCLNWGHIFPLHSVLICVQGQLHGEIVAPPVCFRLHQIPFSLEGEQSRLLGTSGK